LLMPDNRDGRVFRNPHSSSFEIKGWAANKFSEIAISQTKKGGID
jgi:hypothetical protein